MSFALLDVVVLAEDLPDEGLRAGMNGTVVDIHTKPCQAYEVEFCDDAGRTIALLSLLPNQMLSTAAWKSKEMSNASFAGQEGELLNTEGRTPLMSAILARDKNLAESLISQGADVNVLSGHADDREGTALMMAVWANQPDIVELLLEHGADVNVQDTSKETPLIVAASSNLTDIVDLLLKHGANVNLQDRIGRTPLMWACRDTSNIELIKTLLAAGADINLRDDRGWTAKDYADALERKELAVYLSSIG